ncbi:MAG: hypothetical protein V3W06_08905, partial [Acidimicrobiia bacterium]
MMAKAPEDRYQDADELIKDLSEGMDPAAMLTGPTAAATSYPGTAASHHPRPSQARTFSTQGPPPTTPHTPIPSPPHRVAVVVEGRKKRRGGVLVGMFLLLLFGGAGGGGYLYVEGAGGIEPVVERHPALRGLISKLADLGIPLEISAVAADSTETAESTDSTLLATTALGDSTVNADSTVTLDSATVADSIVIDSTGATDSVAAPAVPEVVEPTTGHLIVSNLGPDASMWINNRPVRGLRHDLAPGRYELRVVAPGSKPYKATVTLAVGDTLRHRVRMASALPESQCELLNNSYNRRGECFDQVPRPLVATVIPLDSSVPRFPAQPAILAIQVLANGSVGEVLIKSPSDVPEFTLLAIQFAKDLRFQPGTKNGRPVRGLRHDLAPGRYELRVVAPGSKPYRATVTVAVGDTLRHRVRMASALPESQCARLDDSYNRRGECFDQMPRPLVATVVPVGSSVPRFPAQPAILSIQVLSNGIPGEVLIKSPSDVPEFTLLAIRFAKTLTYQPGTKNGLPVMAWVQVPFYPQQQ